ncbi:MAG: type I 3-dehydroquinate dehydratase [Rhabdochlamydiaceae bacterium]|nr:type I 3-dehydroquinate dehydratase [Rhabdochlamydiaceae bacterium]
MKLVCAPVKKWPKSRPVDLYEFTEGTKKLLYDKEEKLRFIDIDWKAPARSDSNLIVSYHNFDETPDLNEVLSQMKARHPKAQFYKIAAFANSTLDTLRMVHFQRSHKNVIGISMGEKGILTRILSPFTYAPLSEEDKNAPGQLLWSELETIYHYRSLNSETRLYGLLGNPVKQSIGHLYHNDRFFQKNMNAVYVKLLVLPEELPAFFEAIQDLPFWGFSVTAPLKEKIIEGSIINTIYRTKNGWENCNTDGKAAADVLGDIAEKKIVILGVGGAAKAIGAELIKRKAKITFLRRHMEIPPYDILINASSSGDPDFKDHFIPGTIVMDISIRTTPFLMRAKARGCDIMDGLPMFFGQAALQSEIWSRILP